MNRMIRAILMASLASVLVAGCGMGMQPEGPNLDEVKKREAALPPEQQIKLIQSSPMPADQKQQKIAEIQEKYHLSPGDAQSASDQNPGRH